MYLICLSVGWAGQCSVGTACCCWPAPMAGPVVAAQVLAQPGSTVNTDTGLLAEPHTTRWLPHNILKIIIIFSLSHTLPFLLTGGQLKEVQILYMID